jgi:hypothetical protein
VREVPSLVGRRIANPMFESARINID